MKYFLTTLGKYIHLKFKRKEVLKVEEKVTGGRGDRQDLLLPILLIQKDMNLIRRK